MIEELIAIPSKESYWRTIKREKSWIYCNLILFIPKSLSVLLSIFWESIDVPSVYFSIVNDSDILFDKVVSVGGE